MAEPSNNYFSAAAAERKSGAIGTYTRLDELAPLDVGGGVSLQAVAGDMLMLSYVTIQPNGCAPPHTHDEEQMGIVIAGSGVFDLDGVEKAVAPGDIYHAPPGVPHGITAGPSGCVIVDVFSPPRKALVDR